MFGPKVRMTVTELVPRFKEEQVFIIQAFLVHSFRESGRKGVVLGLSGGVDSALVAKLCADALGPQRVLAVAMPEGRGGKDLKDTKRFAKELGIDLRIIGISPVATSLEKRLLAFQADQVARGNLRARARMTVLYFIANTEGRIVIGTGNKSEILSGYFCYDSRTRAVTPAGPKFYWELRPGDTVFSINLETKRLVEVPVESVHVFDYDGEMVRLEGRRLDLLVTPNHRMLIHLNHGRGALAFKPIGSRAMQYSTNLPVPYAWEGLASAPAVIDTGSFLGDLRLSSNSNPPVQMKTHDFLYLMGLFIGDGCASTAKITVPVKSELTAAERLSYRGKDGRFLEVPSSGPGMRTHLARRIFIASAVEKRSRGPLLDVLHRSEIHAVERPTMVVFTNRALFAALESCGVGAKNKRIPQWVLKLPALDLFHLYRGLMDSDGNADHSGYTTTSHVLAFQMVELCAKLGFHAWVTSRPPREREYRGKLIRSGLIYFVNIGERANTLTFTGRNLSRVHYEGKVWCPSVPPHENLLVERNGRVVFSGNTKFGDGAADFLPIGDLYKTQVREMARYLGLPPEIVEKVPTAGLWPGQTDEGELGISYGELDRILLGIELQLEPEAISEKAGVPLDHVRYVQGLVAKGVHKRKMPLIPKVGVRTIGLDWRE
jgi:NH3-dependent NAD+ synthetase